MIQIYFKVQGGPAVSLDVTPDTTVEQTKALIYERAGVPVEHQILKYGGRPMEDRRDLSYYLVSSRSILQVGIQIRPALTEGSPNSVVCPASTASRACSCGHGPTPPPMEFWTSQRAITWARALGATWSESRTHGDALDFLAKRAGITATDLLLMNPLKYESQYMGDVIGPMEFNESLQLALEMVGSKLI